ncbi:carotenoid 1,2-hydratase [Variovorax sp. KK3]|uniref:carotenoid 1,2-hydratase n=1 Tax=Variovorax sp. KK3 TaxID=1855728 RepID=UPI001C4E2300|nr:carotenoid 1,2-hydratase [Variovorax sp. KK3]
MFSPYYAWARLRHGGTADPLDHCAINVALYGESRGEGRWAMTERRRTSVHRDATALHVGASCMRWDGDALVIDIDELTAPVPSRLRGRVRVHPQALAQRSFDLDAAGRHRWRPIAPCARVEIAFERPSLRWQGTGYVDSNTGERPLEADFTRWSWSRSALGHRRCAVLYDPVRRDGTNALLALDFDAQGDAAAFDAPPPAPLPRTGWRLDRATRCDAGAAPALRRTLEDAPFYARSLIETTLLGERAVAVHESLSLARLDTPWCRAMLPFRMPRALR